MLIAKYLNRLRRLLPLQASAKSRSAGSQRLESFFALCEDPWGADGLPALERALGRRPQPAPLAPEVVDREKDGDLVREKVSYGVGKGCRGSAYLLYQEQPDKIRRPAVLAIHGHGGDFSQGKSKVVRARNTSDTYGYGRGLAQRGFVVLAPDMAGFEDRQLIIESRQTPWPFDPERLLHCGLLLHGATLMGLYLFELQRALDFLCHCQDMVDPTRIAVIGHSMGGTLAPMLMLIDQRVCAGVSAAGLATWRSLLDFAVIHNFGAYLPGVLPGSDLDAMLCQLAPRPLMVIAGEQDPNFPLAGVNALVSSLKKIYAQKGRSENLAIMIHPGGHPFTEEQQSRAWVFLGRRLLRSKSEEVEEAR